MKTTMTAIALALAVTGVGVSMPATATAQDKAEQPSLDLSKDARKALVPLQKAVNEKDHSNIDALIAAADNAAKTADDKYLVAELKLNYAAGIDDLALMRTAVNELAASNSVHVDPGYIFDLNTNLAKMAYNEGDYQMAASLFARSLEMQPDYDEGVMLLGQSYEQAGNTDKAVETYQRYIRLRSAANANVPEDWYRRTIALGLEDNSAYVLPVAIQWVRAFPTKDNWSDTIRIYQDSTQLTDADYVDILRLSRNVGTISVGGDYAFLADQLLAGGYPGEALAVIQEGIDAGLVDLNDKAFAEVYSMAQSQSKGDREGLQTVAELRGGELRPITGNANAYYGYGEYGTAAELYRAALTKPGVNSNVVNLRLGMALGMNGDIAGADAALDQVEGKFANLAKLWQAYFATRQ